MQYKWTKEHYEAAEDWVKAAHGLGDTSITVKWAMARFKLEQWSVEQILRDTVFLLRKLREV